MKRWIAVRVLVAGCVVLAAGAGCGGKQPVGAADTTHTVTLTVIGVEGATKGDIDISGAAPEQPPKLKGEPLPWSLAVAVTNGAGEARTISVSAIPTTNPLGGKVGCSVAVDGKVVKQETPGLFAYCHYDVK